MLSYLRQTGLAQDIEALPPNTRWRGISRRLTSDLGRTRAVALPFRFPSGWRAVETLADLWAVGRRMSNCVADLRRSGDYHVHEMVSGRHMFITTTEEPLALATLQRLGEASWTISKIEVKEAEHRRNGKFRETLMTDLAAVAAEVEHTFYDECPLSAIYSLVRRSDCSVWDLGDDPLDVVA